MRRRGASRLALGGRWLRGAHRHACPHRRASTLEINIIERSFRQAHATGPVMGYELCMGNRFAGQIMPNAMPWKNRHIGNPALTGILNLLFRSRMGDAHCGLRAFTKTAFERMRLTSTGMEFASEILIKAALLDLSRAEVPITLHPDKRNRP